MVLHGKAVVPGMWDPIKKEWAFYQRGRLELYTPKTPQDLKLSSDDVGQMLVAFGIVQLPQLPVWWSSYHWEVPESPLSIMAGAELPARREPVADSPPGFYGWHRVPSSIPQTHIECRVLGPRREHWSGLSPAAWLYKLSSTTNASILCLFDAHFPDNLKAIGYAKQMDGKVNIKDSCGQDHTLPVFKFVRRDDLAEHDCPQYVHVDLVGWYKTRWDQCRERSWFRGSIGMGKRLRVSQGRV